MNPTHQYTTPRSLPLVIVAETIGSKAAGKLRAALPDADFVEGPIEIPTALPDAVLVIDASKDWAAVTDALSNSRAMAGRVVLITARRDAGALVAALRAGVADVIAATDTDFAVSLHEAVDRIWERVLMSSKRRAERRALQARSRADQVLHRRMLTQTRTLCTDLAKTCRGLGMELASVAMASEVNALFRQELDLEGLLRTTLEYTLRKVGPTNAVVFLRNSCEDFEVGAYANYDAPRESCEDMLDLLASALPDAVGSESEPFALHSADAIVGVLGELPETLRDASVLAVGCGAGGETNAVIAMFRDRNQGFGETANRTLRIVGRIFGEQAERIRRTQSRHLGGPGWLGANDPELGEDHGLAA